MCEAALGCQDALHSYFSCVFLIQRATQGFADLTLKTDMYLTYG